MLGAIDLRVRMRFYVQFSRDLDVLTNTLLSDACKIISDSLYPIAEPLFEGLG